MISSLSVKALSLVNQCSRIYVHDDELRITKNGSTDYVHINCIYTKSEIDKLINDVNNDAADDEPDIKLDTYFTLNESSQLYLCKPSYISQTSKHYVMSWQIDSNYAIEQQTQFTFKDYLFGHTCDLT